MLKRYARIYAPGGKYSPISRGKEILGPHLWGVHCAQEHFCTGPPQWSGSVSMFTYFSVTSVLILIQGRTLVESSSQGSQGRKQWKSSWLPSARKGPLETLWLDGAGVIWPPLRRLSLWPWAGPAAFACSLGEPQPHMDPMEGGMCVLVLSGSVMSDFASLLMVAC